MQQPRPTARKTEPRRDFLKTTAGIGLAAGLIPNAVHAGVSEVIKIGLVGCGGRGTAAATDAMKADKGVHLVAMGDLFPDRLDGSFEHLKNESQSKGRTGQFQVTREKCFSGWDAVQKVLASDIDVVLLCTPPHFRPMHFQAAIAAGKHVFCEKPVAVDAPGVRSVIASCAEAKKKNLTVVSGLCWRYDPPMRETIGRILDGDIGQIIALNTNYNVEGLWHKDRKPEWSDMEWQLRNWLYFTWLSGDHIVEQHVHSIDKMAWVMGDQYPVKAFGLGGRQSRTQSEFGHIFDHHATCFEFANGVRCFSYCRQQDGTSPDVSDHVFGSKGTANLMKFSIQGDKAWTRPRSRKPTDMYLEEHKALFAGLRAGKRIDNGDYMTRSTLMGIMGRMACYTGKIISWDEAMASKEHLGPTDYAFTSMAVPEVAKPGITKFA